MSPSKGRVIAEGAESRFLAKPDRCLNTKTHSRKGPTSLSSHSSSTLRFLSGAVADLVSGHSKTNISPGPDRGRREEEGGREEEEKEEEEEEEERGRRRQEGVGEGEVKKGVAY